MARRWQALDWLTELIVLMCGILQLDLHVSVVVIQK